MRNFLPILALPVLLSGCGVEPFATPLMTNLAMGGATVASYSVLGQSPADYAISKFRGQDCDVRNPKKYDGLYCVNGKYEPIVEPAVYCYRSLGDTDCSDRLDPYGNRNNPIVRHPPFTAATAPAALSPSVSDVPVAAPTRLGSAGTTPVARPSTPSPAAPAALTPDDMAVKGS